MIKRHPSVKKISFIGHSLGGLIARYAIAKLYVRDLTKELPQGNGDCRTDVNVDTGMEEQIKSKIAGLEPVNFITLATPHLGSRWHKQVMHLFLFFSCRFFSSEMFKYWFLFNVIA